MRHLKAGKKLGRTSAHRKALFRNQVTALFRNDSIITTVAKAKAVKPIAEKLITKAKKGTLHARRQVMQQIKDKEVVKRLFDVIAVKYESRHGGYTRVLKLSKFRAGDGAPLALLELVEPYHETDEQREKEKVEEKINESRVKQEDANKDLNDNINKSSSITEGNVK